MIDLQVQHPAKPLPTVFETVYPESRFGGFSRCDSDVHFYSRVRSLVTSDCRVLDVGCGRGLRLNDDSEYRRNLRWLDGHVVGIDVDPAAKSNPSLDEFRLIEYDSWPVGREAFDLVLCDYVLEHVSDPARFFQNVFHALRPGGVLCLRTPNANCYPCLVARLVPNRWHGWIIERVKGTRQAKDVFPTVYKANTKRRLQRLLKRHGLDGVVYRIESEPSYLRFSPTLYRIGSVVHRLLPPIFQSTLLAFAEKKQ